MITFKGQSLYLTREEACDLLVKTASSKLGRDPTMWESEIMEMLHEQFPYLVDSKISIGLKKTEKETGTAVGSITIDDKVMIPLIINDFKISPLDIFSNGQELFPVTRVRLEQMLRGGEIGKPVAPGKGEATDSAITSLTTPPYDGKYTFAGSLDYTKEDFSTSISRSFSEQGLTFELYTNPIWKEALASYLNSSQEVIKTAACAKPALKKKSVGKPYMPKTAGIYSNYLTGDNYLYLDKVVSIEPWPESRGIAVNLSNKKDGLDYGMVDDHDFAVKTAEAGKQSILFGDEPTGFGFFLIEKEGKYQATQPLTVLFKEGQAYGAEGLFGNSTTVYVDDSFQNIERSGTSLGIPRNATFHKLAHNTALPLTKVAALLEEDPNDLVIERRGWKYRIVKHQPEFDKIAELRSEGSYLDELKLVLSAYYDIETLEALDLIKVGETEVFEGITYETPTPKPEIKLSDEDLIAITKTASYFDDRTTDFLKMSAAEAKKTVDALLSLNFLGPQNLEKFMEKTEHITQARQAVAELLIAARLGLDLDQAPLRTALFALDNVENDLTQLQAVTSASTS